MLYLPFRQIYSLKEVDRQAMQLFKAIDAKCKEEPQIEKIEQKFELMDVPNDIIDTFMKKNGLKKREKEHLLKIASQILKRERDIAELDMPEALSQHTTLRNNQERLANYSYFSNLFGDEKDSIKKSIKRSLVYKLINKVKKHRLSKHIKGSNEGVQVRSKVFPDMFTTTEDIEDTLEKSSTMWFKPIVHKSEKIDDDLPNFEDLICQTQMKENDFIKFKEFEDEESDGIPVSRLRSNVGDSFRSKIDSVENMIKDPISPSSDTYEFWKSNSKNSKIKSQMMQYDSTSALSNKFSCQMNRDEAEERKQKSKFQCVTQISAGNWTTHT